MSVFTKDEYLDRIISGLSLIQYELNARNNINLYDIDIISEDFFAGLLNLIYGYELKNVNHVKKNSKTIDLYDRKNRITVQVTRDNSCEKIQGTINGYYKGNTEQHNKKQICSQKRIPVPYYLRKSALYQANKFFLSAR